MSLPYKQTLTILNQGGKGKLHRSKRMSLLADMAKNPKRQKTAAPQPIISTSKKENEDEEDSDTAENDLISEVEGQEENQAESEDTTDVILAELCRHSSRPKKWDHRSQRS